MKTSIIKKWHCFNMWIVNLQHPAETSKNSDICDFLKVSDIGIAL